MRQKKAVVRDLRLIWNSFEISTKSWMLIRTFPLTHCQSSKHENAKGVWVGGETWREKWTRNGEHCSQSLIIIWSLTISQHVNRIANLNNASFLYAREKKTNLIPSGTWSSKSFSFIYFSAREYLQITAVAAACEKVENLLLPAGALLGIIYMWIYAGSTRSFTCESTETLTTMSGGVSGN